MKYILAALGLTFALAATPALSQELVPFDDIFKMADSNKDGMVSKQEYLKMMGDRYDAMMAKMKTMPSRDKLMKGDAMSRDGLKMLFDTTYRGA